MYSPVLLITQTSSIGESLIAACKSWGLTIKGVNTLLSGVRTEYFH